MQELIKLTDIQLLRLQIRATSLRIIWLTRYPYMYYPKEKFEKRYAKLENICTLLIDECKKRKLLE